MSFFYDDKIQSIECDNFLLIITMPDFFPTQIVKSARCLVHVCFFTRSLKSSFKLSAKKRGKNGIFFILFSQANIAMYFFFYE